MNAATMEKPIDQLSDDEILERFPKPPARAPESYTDAELVKFKDMGPVFLGGALYCYVRDWRRATAGGRAGPAVTSKSSEPVTNVTLVGTPDDPATRVAPKPQAKKARP